MPRKRNKKTAIKRAAEYCEKGDYHIHLDSSWPYLPVYLEKMTYVKKLLNQYGKNKKIIDLGCGEGVLVKEFNKKSFDIIGLDLNYQSKFVKRGNILNTKYPNNSFDIILCLDVIEHLSFHEQNIAIQEMSRILKSGGKLIITIPNLAHLASRFSFFFLGKLLRTSKIDRHIGDRPISEHLKLLKFNFTILKRKGFFPTFPLISALTYFKPSKAIFLHKIYNKLLGYPNWCLLNILICEKK